MSFLTPLYLLGALAVSLPILFHMIRRMPRDRREFSSTMFLQPSPPKITRRSRIEHWLLLILRALAVCLLALAFARPFFRGSEQQTLEAGEGRAFVVLIDVSASMRRDRLWNEAVEQLARFLNDDVTPADQVAVMAFAGDLRPLCSFEQWAALDVGQRGDFATASVAGTSPGWGATNLAAALIKAAEQLDVLTTKENVYQSREVIVISDLQSGSRLELLQEYDWPKGIGVTLIPVGDETSFNNAGIHIVSDTSVGSGIKAKQTRVRITNAAGADRDEFRIRWTDEFDGASIDRAVSDAASPDEADGSVVSVIVPSGQSRVVRVGPRPDGPGSGRLRLDGDEHDFDNLCFVPPPRPRSAVVALLGGEAADDPKSMRFYLPAALPSLPQREIHVTRWGESSDDAGEAAAPNLVIVTTAPPDSQIESLQAYVREGGTILFSAPTAEALASVYTLLNVPPVTVTEAEVGDYAMLVGIDFSHPLFAALGDPRYSDFTKVHIWKHRTFSEDSVPQAKVLAKFDDGEVAVVESRFGQGRIIILTTGWQPDDSQLAVSSKFVPMLNGLVDDVAGIAWRRTDYVVGEPVSLSEFDLSADQIEAVRTPTGERVTLAKEAEAFTATQTPGVYRFLLKEASANGDEPPSFAVNLDPAESRTSRLPDETLRSAGVRLTAEESETVVDEAARRQLRAGELENRQKLWRWLVVAVIALLVAETLLASRAARRQLASS